MIGRLLAPAFGGISMTVYLRVLREFGFGLFLIAAMVLAFFLTITLAKANGVYDKDDWQLGTVGEWTYHSPVYRQISGGSVGTTWHMWQFSICVLNSSTARHCDRRSYQPYIITWPLPHWRNAKWGIGMIPDHWRVSPD
jgi:hypothetical protein